MTTRKVPLEVATALSHSDYWCVQAQETRLAAQRIEAPEAREDLLAKADEYDRRRRLQQRVGNPAAHCWVNKVSDRFL